MLVISACKKADHPDRASDGSVATPGAMLVGSGSGEGSGVAEPTRVTPPKPARTTLAKRCTLGGDPLVAGCGGNGGIAVAKDGTLLVVDGRKVRRYQRTPGDACNFEPRGEPIELPPDNPRPQPLGKGPVYMRSGGADWSLVRAGDAIYAHDFLGGLFRIDRGKPEPSCDDVFGFQSVASLGKRMLVARKGIEELRLGAACKAVSAKLDDKARGKLYVAHDVLYRSEGKHLFRYAGATPTELGEGTRICFVSGFAACGGGACIIDSNCMQVIQLGADGKVLRVLDDDKLFAARPWSLAEATTDDAGDVFLLARHRDKANDKEICEAAVYELPAALFAL